MFFFGLDLRVRNSLLRFCCVLEWVVGDMFCFGRYWCVSVAAFCFFFGVFGLGGGGGEGCFFFELLNMCFWRFLMVLVCCVGGLGVFTFFCFASILFI